MIDQRLYVRADAQAETGIGHFMRCLALGQAWLDGGGTVTFIGRHDESLRRALEEEGVDRIEIGQAHTPEEDLRLTLKAVPAGAPVVLDGYSFDGSYQRELAAHATLLIIDDTGHLPAYWGRILLNQNPAAEHVRYLHAPQNRLLGPRYALLRREFVSARRPRTAPDKARRILLTFGGVDEQGCAGAIADELLAGSPDIDLRILVGPVNAHRPDLERLQEKYRKLELVAAPRDIAAELAWADLVISAAGSTALELAALGVPALLVAVAANQQRTGRALDAAGAAVYLGAWSGLTAGEVAARGLDLVKDQTRRRDLGAKGHRLIDDAGRSDDVFRPELTVLGNTRALQVGRSDE